MRNISPESLNKIQQKLGTEPINVIGIKWGTASTLFYYSDKYFTITQQEANQTVSSSMIIEGRILELSNLENVVKLSDNARSQTISIILDDTDGGLKTLIDNVDIHKVPVFVYQWFTGIPFHEAFLIFEGQISSPIVWKEAERTLSFDVVEQLEENEVGFSPEEGQFDFIPFELIGKAWPLGFGTNQFVPATQLNEPPSGIITNALGVGDPSLRFKIDKNKATQKDFRSLIAAYEAYALSEAGIVTRIDFAIQALQFELADPTSGAASEPAQILGSMDISTSFSNSTSVDPTYGSQPNNSNVDNLKLPADAGSVSISSSISSSGDGSLSNELNTFFESSPDPSAIESAIQNLESQRNQHESQQRSFEQQAARLAADEAKVRSDNEKLIAEQFRQESFFGTVGVIPTLTGVPFPSGPVRVKIGEVEVDGYFAGSGNIWAFTPSGNAINPNDNREFINSNYPASNPLPDNNPNDTTKFIQKTQFYIAQPGTSIRIISLYPIHYVVNIIPSTVWSVWANRKIGSKSVLTNVPVTLYSTQVTDFGTVVENDGIILQGIRPTTLIFPRALSTYDEGWEDKIFVTFTSPVGPNTVDIISYVLKSYSKLAIDTDSFLNCRTFLLNYPSHFVLLDRKNIIQFLEEVCFQARLQIYISNNTVFLRYIPAHYASVDTITEDDIEFGTLELEGTRTEDLVTKLVASWQPNYLPDKPNEIIVRNNIYKYGIHERKYDFYIYNIQGLVELAVTFWIIRKSNTFKILKFKTPLHKLNLETFDTIILDFKNNFVSNGPVGAIIISNKYDSKTNTIDFEVWVPVRVGEMIEYPFALPFDLPLVEIFPSVKEIIEYNASEPVNPNIFVSGEIPGARVTINAPNSPVNLKSNKSNISGQSLVSNLSDQLFGTFKIDNIDHGTVTNSTPGLIELKTNGAIPNQGTQLIAVPPSSNNINNLSPILLGSLLNVLPGTNPLSKILQLEAGLSVPAGWTIIGNILGQIIKNPTGPQPDYQYHEYPTPVLTPIPQVPEKPTLSGAGGGGIPGRIVSGTSNTYQVDIYPNGLNNNAKRVTVSQLEIDPSETIPPGTWALVSKIGNNYYMQVAVWL